MVRALTVIAVVLLFCAATSYAQIEIEAREFPRMPGQQFQFYSLSADSIPVNLGTPGGPQVWDYSTGDTTTITTDLLLDPAQSPPEYSRANVVIHTDQLSLFGLNEPGTQYCFICRPRFIWAAFETVYEGQTVGAWFQPYINQFYFPIQYGNTWTNSTTVYEEYTFPDYDMKIEGTATIVSTADAYGTVMVPLGSYETLRIRNEINYHFVVSIRILWVWVPVLEETGDAMQYDWRAENVGSVLNISAQTTNPNFQYADAVRRLMSATTLASDELIAATQPVQAPVEFTLEGSYPNPFNAETVISYTLPKDMNVDLRVYNIVGREVAILDQGMCAEGVHEVHWLPNNVGGGIYFAQLKADGQIQNHMMVYLK
ncbi:MAG: T9SS type A sorting domain-containing protein [bacterium]